eukprot:COSAG01_NODE_1480_length_10161_cov_32.805804_3_plen_44_part_00
MFTLIGSRHEQVGPGYDDTGIRPWNSMNTKARDKGNYYQQMWQ